MVAADRPTIATEAKIRVDEEEEEETDVDPIGMGSWLGE
jgi:hypothetical protein